MSEFQPVTLKRPRDVWVASIVLVLFGLLGILVGLLLLAAVENDRDHGQSVGALASLLAVATVALAILQAVSGAFVFVGREWARVTGIVICAVNVLAGLFTLVSGGAAQACVGIAVNVALIVALNKEAVADWCRARPGP
ncbi:hypothetical protein OHA72_34030 [Dactylosporangium sp. NBC_01737]|uniref:DUF7144 family membrane protein n=1 Tax=Dactylosporangium sp. NBC_01737 TaxID=2975959 RepID=UPI002E10DDF7|nr:hypothetical protein OHA72_34030 [Dactylosporangium sp. NBC_01737]